MFLFSHPVASDLFVTPWTATRQASLSFTVPEVGSNSSTESEMPSIHLTVCHLLLLISIFPNIRVFFSVSWLCASSGQGIGASASVLPMKIQG